MFRNRWFVRQDSKCIYYKIWLIIIELKWCHQHLSTKLHSSKFPLGVWGVFGRWVVVFVPHRLDDIIDYENGWQAALGIGGRTLPPVSAGTLVSSTIRVLVEHQEPFTVRRCDEFGWKSKMYLSVCIYSRVLRIFLFQWGTFIGRSTKVEVTKIYLLVPTLFYMFSKYLFRLCIH